MYIYNKFCVHSHNAAKGVLFSPPPSVCDSVTAVRLLPFITMPLALTADPAIPSDH